MADHVIAAVESIDPGERLLVEINGLEYVVFNVDGEFHAYVNWCPHQGGPICEGTIDGTIDATFDRPSLETKLSWIKDDEVIVCPWHGWEFDLQTGTSLHDERIKVPSASVRIEDDNIVLSR